MRKIITVMLILGLAGVAIAPSAHAKRAGDMNCDSSVDSVDVALTLQMAAHIWGENTTEPACKDEADADMDGEITAVDAALILQWHAGLAEPAVPWRERTPPIPIRDGHASR